MKRKLIVQAMLTIFAVTAALAPSTRKTEAQTGNTHSKFTITEQFTFPNECTSELMDVSDTTTVTCHDQIRGDGSFSEKCEIRQDVTATGETTAIIWHGTATFKDELITTDGCNFSFSNRGKVHLISAGNTPNTIITFDDLVRMENCVLTADLHLVSFDCRGAGKP